MIAIGPLGVGSHCSRRSVSLPSRNSAFPPGRLPGILRVAEVRLQAIVQRRGTLLRSVGAEPCLNLFLEVVLDGGDRLRQRPCTAAQLDYRLLRVVRAF